SSSTRSSPASCSGWAAGRARNAGGPRSASSKHRRPPYAFAAPRRSSVELLIELQPSGAHTRSFPKTGPADEEERHGREYSGREPAAESRRGDGSHVVRALRRDPVGPPGL